MRKRKCRLITACLLSATLTSSMLCSSIVLASEVPSVPTETQELDESAVPIEEDKKEETGTQEEKPETDIQQDEETNEVGNGNVDENVSEPQIRTYANQEADGIQTYADESYNAGDFNVIGGTEGTDWAYTNTALYDNFPDKCLNIKKNGTYTIEGSGAETTERILVSDNFNGTITIKNVNINATHMVDGWASGMTAFEISPTANLTLVLDGSNSLQSGTSCAGLQLNNFSTSGSLKICGDGSLIAKGGSYSSGIGGRGGIRNITIEGGNISAEGYNGGAGIGGGNNGSVTNITITGGNITATGNDGGAGIGSGSNGSATDIKITGGNITATGNDGGAGIGGGQNGSATDITITGGNIYSESNCGNYTYNNNIADSSAGAAIGSGRKSQVGNITISGGTVTAKSNNKYWYEDWWHDGYIPEGDGIGFGYSGSATGNIKITGGSVKASRIGSAPINDDNNPVYLAQLNNLGDVNSVTVDTTEYTRDGNHKDNDSSFYLYLVGETNHEIVASGVKYVAKWNGSNRFSVKQPTPTPTVSIDTSKTTANSITVTALEDTYGTAQYSLNGRDWQNENVFTNLHSQNYGGNDYTIYARYLENDNYFQSDNGTLSNVMTNGATYKITIPATTLTAGKSDSTAQISVDSTASFDLGFNGQVDVKIAKNGKVTDNAKLNLTRTNDTETVITSALLVGGNPLDDITKSVATFRASTDTPVSISFAKPTETDIPAGTYNGTITFEISYSEQTTP